MSIPPPPRRAVLQVAWGAAAARRVILQPGDVVRVGRGEEADLSLPHDRKLARIHFEIDWDGARGQVRSRDDARPTLASGLAVRKAYVPHGSSLRAGDTWFTFHVEGHTPPLQAAAPDRARAEVLRTLRAELHLWAVLDAARDDRILQLLRESVDESRHLYEGPPGDPLAEVAPYLVRFRADSALLDSLVLEGWGQAWGVYFTWDAPTKDVRRHLRRFLMVEEEEARRRLYFRFYDPRVLVRFLPTCSVRQLATFHGELDRFLVEGPSGELLTFRRDPAPSAEPAPEG